MFTGVCGILVGFGWVVFTWGWLVITGVVGLGLVVGFWFVRIWLFLLVVVGDCWLLGFVVGVILLGFRVTCVVVGWGVVVVVDGGGGGWLFWVRGRLRLNLPFRFGCGSNICAINLCTILPSCFLP